MVTAIPRTLNVARELSPHGSPGDRAVILAPQGFDYITAFLGAMQAGLIAVPLPLPHRGASHERVSAVLADTSPSVVLTTSASQKTSPITSMIPLDNVPKIVEIDSMNLDADGGTSLRTDDLPTRVPAVQLGFNPAAHRSHDHAPQRAGEFRAVDAQLLRGPNRAPADATIVSWLPLYHDMGLVLGVCAPILSGHRGSCRARLRSWKGLPDGCELWPRHPTTWSAAPNFAFDLAARKTTDSDLAGLDLGGVLGIINGAERVEPATLERFADRFAHFNFQDPMLRPSYGLAEATVFVALASGRESTPAVHFDVDELAAGRVQRTAPGTGTALIQYNVPQSPWCGSSTRTPIASARLDIVGEIWVHGDNVADGYWRRPPEEQRCFSATLVDPSPGTPDGPWLRTGDLGFVSGSELFIVGRIKDLVIIRGRNHYPEDIEATVQEITRGRVAAISVPLDSTDSWSPSSRSRSVATPTRTRRTSSARSKAMSHRRSRMRTA